MGKKKQRKFGNMFKPQMNWIKKGEEGNAMDEFEAHRFLEKDGQPLTVVAMRKELKKIDLDTDNKMSLLEYCVYHYKVDINTMMSRPQGVNEELEKAEAA